MGHHEFSPSSFPAWIQCLHYVSDQTGTDDVKSPAFRGTLQHTHLLDEELTFYQANGVRGEGSSFPTYSELEAEEVANVDYAFSSILSIIYDNGVPIEDVRFEQEITAFTSDMVAVTGTADVIFTNPSTDKVVVIDYKSGKEKDYEPQLKVYGLGGMQGANLAEVDVYTVYGRDRKTPPPSTYSLEEAETFFDEMVEKLINKDDHEPKACSFCTWCVSRNKCKGRNKALIDSKKLLDVENNPLKGITVRTDLSKLNPTKLGALMDYAKLLEGLSSDIKAICKKQLIKDENNVEGYKLVYKKASAKIDPVKAEEIALEVFGIEPLQLVEKSSLSKASLMELIYKKEAGKKASKDDFAEKFAEAMTYGNAPAPQLTKIKTEKKG